MANDSVYRSVMTLFSDPRCHRSHRARLVMTAKDVVCETEDYDPNNPPEDLLTVNPYGYSPTLIDRDLVLYDSRVIIDYIDERFPHPPLLPVDPTERARFRLILFRIESQWYPLVDQILADNGRESDKARKYLRESIVEVAEAVAHTPFFMYQDVSLIDCTIIPILWRLKHLGVDLPRQARPVQNYADRVFNTAVFRQSLSLVEKTYNT